MMVMVLVMVLVMVMVMLLLLLLLMMMMTMAMAMTTTTTMTTSTMMMMIMITTISISKSLEDVSRPTLGHNIIIKIVLKATIYMAPLLGHAATRSALHCLCLSSCCFPCCYGQR